MKQNQFEFKPFDKVLTRDSKESVQKIELYSHSYQNNDGIFHACVGHTWRYCIPYNEETAHLLGTNEPYQPKQKEIKYIVTYGFGKDLTVTSYTEEEFKKFINVAVINNKDVQYFTVEMIIPD